MKKSLIDVIGYTIGAVVLAIIVLSVILVIRWLPGTGFGDWTAGGFARGNFQEEGEETAEGDIEEVSVSNIAGSITVTVWEKDQISVGYIKTAPTEEELANLVVQLDRRGKSLTVKPVRQKTGRVMRGSVSFDIFVPEGVTDIQASSVSGSVQLRNMSDTVNQRLSSTSGRIETDMSSDLDVSSVSGSIVFSFAGKQLKAKSVSGRVEGVVESIEDNGSIDLGSTSGSVVLRVPENLDATVNLHSVSGSVSSALPVSVTSAKRNRLEGVIGEGRIPVDIGTVSGSIRLDKR